MNKKLRIDETYICFHHGVDIRSAGMPYLKVIRWGSSKILDMIV